MSPPFPPAPPLPVAIVSVSPVLLNLLGRGLGGHPGIEVVGARNLHGEPIDRLAAGIRGAALLILDFDPDRTDDVRRGGDLRAALQIPVLLFVPDLTPVLATTLRRQGFPVVRRRPDLLSLTSPERLEPLFNIMRAVAEGRPVGADVGPPREATAAQAADPRTEDRRRAAATPPEGNRRPEPGRFPSPSALVVIGASTGGPQVVRRVLQEIPVDDRWAIAIVQHISPAFAEGFARWLTESTDHTVTLAVDGELILGGAVVVAPGDTHLTVSRERWHLDHGPKRLFQRPSADNLFESAARSWGDQTIGVLLTGMGRDGGEGCRGIVDAGGYTVVQDEATSAVYGMPRAAVESGGASEVVPLEALGERVVSVLLKRVKM
jgi:hypothetical protein